MIYKDEAGTIYDESGAATYEFRDDGLAIHCRVCKRTSYSKEDVKNLFCVACGYHTPAGAFARAKRRIMRVFKWC